MLNTKHSASLYVAPTTYMWIPTYVWALVPGPRINDSVPDTPLGCAIRLCTKILLPTLFTNPQLLLRALLADSPPHQFIQDKLSNCFISSKLFGLVSTSAGLISPRTLLKTIFFLRTISCSHKTECLNVVACLIPFGMRLTSLQSYRPTNGYSLPSQGPS